MSKALRKPDPIDPVDLAARADGIRSAVASARLEGVDVTPATQQVLDDFVGGIIDADEMVNRVLGMSGPGA